MIKKTIYCDRCGKKCKKIRNNRGKLLYTAGGNPLDLCQSCHNDLNAWFKQGKNKEATGYEELLSDMEDKLRTYTYASSDRKEGFRAAYTMVQEYTTGDGPEGED